MCAGSSSVFFVNYYSPSKQSPEPNHSPKKNLETEPEWGVDNSFTPSVSSEDPQAAASHPVLIQRQFSPQNNPGLGGDRNFVPNSAVSPQLDNMKDLEKQISQQGCIDWNGPDDPVGFRQRSTGKKQPNDLD